MNRNRWEIKKIPWYFSAKKRLGNLVLCLQFLCLGIGFFKGFPSKCTVPLWENIVWLFDFPQRLPLSASGLGASANALGITGAIFIWIVNLAFQQICTVPMKRLYKWAYPHYLFNFIFSEALLLCCIYCGEAAGQDGSPVQAAYFFLGGLCGFIYILHMCIAFVFDASKLKKIVHSYIISKINDEKKRVFGRGWLWEQHLLEDSYDCLEGEYYDNLETILNESLTVGYGDIEGTFKGENPRNPSRDGEADEISFFCEQYDIWSTIIGGKPLPAYSRLMELEVERMRQELTDHTFFPAFQFAKEEASSPDQTKDSTPPDVNLNSIEAVPGRVCWFLTLIQHSKNKDFAHVMRHMYGLAVRRLVRGPSNASLPQEAVDYIFHELLIASYIYFSLNDAYTCPCDDWYTALVQTWEGISTEFVLHEDRFDVLFSWSTLMYAAVNKWSHKYYVCQENILRKISYSVKSSLLNQAIVNPVQIRATDAAQKN